MSSKDCVPVNSEFFQRYEQTLAAYHADPVIQQLAAELALAGTPDSRLLDAAGSPRMPFAGKAHDEYRRRGGQLTGHLTAPAEAIAWLAYRAPRETWRVDTDQGEQWWFHAVTPVELALLVGARAAAECALPAEELTANLTDTGGAVYHGDQVFLTFTARRGDNTDTAA